MEAPIFKSIHQALHVSFLVMSVEARQDSPMRGVLLQMLGNAESLTARQREWMHELLGVGGGGTINFGGLTPDEIRGQCAMVTKAVEHHLPEPGMHVIRARYIPTEIEEVAGDVFLVDTFGTCRQSKANRFYYSQPRVDSVKWLASWGYARCAGIKLEAMDYMVAKVFAERKEVEISFRDMAATFGGNHLRYYRAYPKLKECMKELEKRAIDRLTVHFESTGLVASNLG